MENYIALIKKPDLLSVMGAEKLSVGESFGLFFKEFASSVDRRVANLSKSVHVVDTNALRRTLQSRKTNFVKNVGVPILVPEAYSPGIANMMAYTKGVCEAVYMVSSLKTETVRLYDWLKQFIKMGRADSAFRWSISNFDSAMDRSVQFVRGLSDDSRYKKCPLGEVYISFDEMFAVLDTYNVQVKLLGPRDPELAARELTRVYELGQLLVDKIKGNDLVVDTAAITEVELVINRFVELTNLCGALMTLLNELNAVFKEQIDQVSRL